ncbi:MAG: hypothetical protein PWQ29_452 [Verrucomicrobiota bacterium]|nr:hypothetical protein [Verrucomicrobiota bacterium]MDK2963058.1 hypothetical protein [Verrucomicrobiota bacterium]
MTHEKDIQLCSVFHRHLREGRIDQGNLKDILSILHADEADGVWTWGFLGSSLLRSVAAAFIKMPDNLFLRAGDALHLHTA